MDTLERLQNLFRIVFLDDSLELTRETTADEVEAWDSVQHVTLIMEVENEFNIRFSTPEIAYLKDVGELIDLIEKKRK